LTCTANGTTVLATTAASGTFTLTEGEHNIRCTATDTFGNSGAAANSTAMPKLYKIDQTAPVAQAGPAAKFVAVTRLPAGAIPVTIFAWQFTDAISGLSRYVLRGTTDSGAVQNLNMPAPLSPSDRRYLAPGHSYTFFLRADDVAGNRSEPSPSVAFTLLNANESDAAAVFTGNWDLRSQAWAKGGLLKTTSQANATVTYTFTGTDIAWISARGTDRGQAEVRIDGGAPMLVDLYTTRLEGRRIVFAAKVPAGQHTIEIRVLGTKNPASSGLRVDVDGFAVLS
jgi:hypothetical protein